MEGARVMDPEVRVFVAREGAASVALDGDTFSLEASTVVSGVRIVSWWHEEHCKVLTEGCTCRKHRDEAS